MTLTVMYETHDKLDITTKKRINIVIQRRLLALETHMTYPGLDTQRHVLLCNGAPFQ